MTIVENKNMEKIKLEYIDESTFQKSEISFTKEHYDLAKQIHSEIGNYGELIISSDEKSFSFCVNLGKNRLDREKGTNSYRVKIEKI